MKKLFHNTLLVTLLIAFLLLSYQNYRLRMENRSLEADYLLATEELRIEKLHHEHNFWSQIRQIKKLEDELDSVRSVSE